MPLDSAQLRQWAVRGAEQRLMEIAAEAAAIYQTFPELRDRRGAGDLPTAAKAGGRRGRANMSAAQRKAVSERMRKYWAARREGSGAAPAAAKGGSSAKAARGGRRRGPRKMSAAARKRISDAQKKRWADRRRANG